MNTRTQSGFTLYELLITLLIVGVLLTIGVPNMAGFMQNSRMAATANDLHSSFQLGRSEAARSKDNITICASTNSTNRPAATCSGEFEDGWIIFQDTNGNIVRDAGEPLLRSHPAVADGITISTPGQDDYFSYAPTGLGRGNVTGTPAVSTAIICDERGNTIGAGGSSAARLVMITPLGRANVIRDVALITAAGGC